ncbi:hypothetical protein [Acinetobacter tianfuensis]|uniref:Uncharacterized protein n=1 Tax=Acinetobacter tianfuensis TaxID=2419603 RepID=A0A3A8EZX8_9GAMM|nr:hypothetical protein [Acinetobacter tianfuensis]RKG33993.1 hypothetical protein D7V32_01705 [Acinetobacter tianfuensis]
MKYGVISALLITVAWALLSIMQLWLPVVSADVYWKLTVTAGILLSVIVLVTLAIREYITDKKLRKDGFID